MNPFSLLHPPPDEITPDQWIVMAAYLLGASLAYLALWWWTGLIVRWRFSHSLVFTWAGLVLAGLACAALTGREHGVFLMAGAVVIYAPLWISAAVGLLSCLGEPAEARSRARAIGLPCVVLAALTLEPMLAVVGLFLASLGAGFGRWQTYHRQERLYPR